MNSKTLKSIYTKNSKYKIWLYNAYGLTKKSTNYELITTKRIFQGNFSHLRPVLTDTNLFSLY